MAIVLLMHLQTHFQKQLESNKKKGKLIFALCSDYVMIMLELQSFKNKICIQHACGIFVLLHLIHSNFQ